MRSRRLGLGLVLYLASFMVMAEPGYARFYGTYAGETTDISGNAEIRRDLGVVIAPSKDGFRIDWKTVTIRADGRQKENRHSIEFFPSGRENIFTSAMRANLFGGRQPLDPMKGDPYVWARINDHTLTVNALLINDAGGYEMLTYARTLTPLGLHLVFDRVADGIPQKRVEAELKRVE